mmetsp:Transcript_18072/g.44354  ORF Transcript_18072/g.44354 Transcript_18072/m.44354 type:complete len:314 (+) Transcript_18072:279-1220(+)
MQPIFPKETPDKPTALQYEERQRPYTTCDTRIQQTAPVALTLKQHLIAGGLSRGAAVTSMFPVDTIKTRLQMSAAANLKEVIKPPYYAGYNAAIASQIPYGMAVFGTYESMKGALIKRFPDTNKLGLFFVAAVAGDLVGSLVLTPGEVVKQRVQAGQFKDPGAAVVAIYKNKGVRGFYQGYLSLVARDLPFRALQLPLYETFKKFYADKRCCGNIDAIGPPQAAFLGALAGMIAAAATNPVDVIKTQMMLSDGSQGVVAAVAKILKENPAAFLSGMPQRVGFLGGSSAVFFIMYEFIRGTMTDGITLDMDMLG